MSTTYTMQERDAIKLIRKVAQTKPDILKEIIKGTAYLSAFGLLHQAQEELNKLLGVTQAFSAAAMAITTQQEESKNANH
jgi:hypothetical protein